MVERTNVGTAWQSSMHSLKEKWSKLTDDDLEGIKGKRVKLEELLKQYYGYDDLAARREVDLWLKQFP